MNAAWLRLVYIFEFLVALPAVLLAWSQIGGQPHLDVMPWWLKLILGAGTSLAIVVLTASVVERERVFTARSIASMILVLLFLAALGLAVYYYHLQEVPDETDEDSTTALVVLAASPRA